MLREVKVTFSHFLKYVWNKCRLDVKQKFRCRHYALRHSFVAVYLVRHVIKYEEIYSANFEFSNHRGSFYRVLRMASVTDVLFHRNPVSARNLDSVFPPQATTLYREYLYRVLERCSCHRNIIE